MEAPTTKIRLATASPATQGTRQETLAQLERLARSAAERKADFLLFPEYARVVYFLFWQCRLLPHVFECSQSTPPPSLPLPKRNEPNICLSMATSNSLVLIERTLVGTPEGPISGVRSGGEPRKAEMSSEGTFGRQLTWVTLLDLLGPAGWGSGQEGNWGVIWEMRLRIRTRILGMKDRQKGEVTVHASNLSASLVRRASSSSWDL